MRYGGIEDKAEVLRIQILIEMEKEWIESVLVGGR